MKSFRFLGIVLCAFVGISTYNANGMETCTNTYNANEENIKINDDILNDANQLNQGNKDAFENDCGSMSVMQLCSSITNQPLTISKLNKLKKELLNDVKFYAKEAKDKGYYGDVKTMTFMSNIFESANELIKKLLSDEQFYNNMKSQIDSIRKCIPQKGLVGFINYQFLH